MKGEDVKALQAALNAAGHDCGEADGDFGAKTDAAVRAFQRAAGLAVDGQAGPKTIAALKAGKGTTSVTPQSDATPGATTGAGRTVRVTGGLVNVRAAPGTSGRIMGVVRKGETLEYQGERIDVDGAPWLLVVYLGANAWISGQYAEVA